MGDWSKDEAVKAISGTKKAGYDLIERESITGMLPADTFSLQAYTEFSKLVKTPPVWILNPFTLVLRLCTGLQPHNLHRP